MAGKKNIPAAVMDVQEQREFASAKVPLAEQIEAAQNVYRDATTGQEARTGVLKASAPRDPGRARDPQFDQKLQTMDRRYAYTKIPACTILNFLPVPLKVNSPMPALNVTVRAVTRDEAFTHHTWERPVYEVSIENEARFPSDFVPAQLGEEFLREYKEQGGVMLFAGTIDELDMEDPAIAKQVDATQQAGFKWMEKKVQEAWGYWNTPNHNQSGNITDVHRLCAQVLQENRRLGKKPDWMDMTVGEREVMPQCPLCRTDVRPGQVVCTNPGCSNILDVRAAFESQLIDESSLLLERLDRATLEDMGISDYVAESKDERPERIAKGLRKPLSKLEQRELASQKAS